MNKTISHDDHERLKEIREEMECLLNEAEQLIRRTGFPYERAKSYWIAHIESALMRNGRFLGASMVTMDDTIDELLPPLVCPNCEESEVDEDGQICDECQMEEVNNNLSDIEQKLKDAL
jgi:tetrahydromethanopterin S-methyltransferase subunit G